MELPEPIALLDGYPLTEVGPYVRLTEAERKRCLLVAEERDRKALAARADPDKHSVDGLGREMVELSSRDRNYVGCVGECAVSLWLDVEWTGAVTDWAHDDDVSGHQVRATIYANGALRCYPEDRSPLILAVLYRDGYVRIAGWKEPSEFTRIWQGVKFAPQRELRSMGEYLWRMDCSAA